MAQDFMFWTTGGAIAEYTQDQWFALLRDLFLYDAATEGVIAGVGDEYEVSGTATPISVGSGRAIVYGSPCSSTAAEEFAIPTPVIDTTGYRVMLRADWNAATNKVSIVVEGSSDGVATPPAVEQVAGDVWEISLATFTITTGGVITVTDTRRFCHFNTALIQQRQGGDAADWCEEGITDYDSPPGSLQQAGAGMISLAGTVSSAYAEITFPVAFSAKPLVLITIGDHNCGAVFGYISVPKTFVTMADCRVYGFTTSPVTDKYINFNWLVIGPR